MAKIMKNFDFFLVLFCKFGTGCRKLIEFSCKFLNASFSEHCSNIAGALTRPLVYKHILLNYTENNLMV